MFEPVRGGTRGGQAEFKWSDVSADKDRENYLGHSINAPTGRWQKNKDVHWYARDKQDSEEERRAEIRKVKEAEAEAMAAALGFAPKAGTSNTSNTTASGANAVPVVPKTIASVGEDLDPEKEERGRRKAERKEEKRLKRERKEKRRAERVAPDDHVDEDEGDFDRRRRRHSHDRSRSPHREDRHHRDYPHKRARSPSERLPHSGTVDYDAMERERERERDRRRWDDNSRRDRPSGSRWNRER